ncbi:MAG: Gfo/Idh/MocA family protein [Opitutales bacterium]
MSRKIRWGILSTAKHAQKAFIPAVRTTTNGEVAAICSRSQEAAQAVANEHGIPKAHGSYEALLNDPEIDAIYNPLPVALHAEWSIRCAEVGKPVLCEKPFTQTAAEAREVAAAFEKAGIPVAESLMWRFHPVAEKVQSLLAEGVIGELVILRTTFNANVQRAGNFRYEKSLGGGALLDLGCYTVSGLRAFACEEPAQVAAVAQFDAATGVDESVTGLLRFPSGKVGYFGVSMATPFSSSYDLTGTQGRIRVDVGGFVTWPGTEFAIEVWGGSREDLEVIKAPAANHYGLVAEDFAQALLDERPPRYPISDAIANMTVLDQLRACIEK